MKLIPLIFFSLVYSAFAQDIPRLPVADAVAKGSDLVGKEVCLIGYLWRFPEEAVLAPDRVEENQRADLTRSMDIDLSAVTDPKPRNSFGQYMIGEIRSIQCHELGSRG